MKKIISLLLAAIVMISSLCVYAEDDIAVTLNGSPIEFDVPAQIIGDRTMVPMRKIFEELGAVVEWIETEQGILAAKDTKIIIMKIGSDLMFVTDVMSGEEQRITLDVPPQIVGDRTLVPVRAIAEGIGTEVGWDAETKTVLLTNGH